MNSNNSSNPMSSDDQRNLIIFCIISLLMYLAYQHFVLAPQREALEKVKQARVAQSQIGSPDVSGNGASQVPVVIDRKESLAKTPRVDIDNGQLHGTILLKGARLDDVTLKPYYKTLDKDENVEILSPKKTAHPRYIEHGWVSADASVKVPTSESFWQVQGDVYSLTPSRPLTLAWDNGSGLTFVDQYSIDEEHMITLNQSVQNYSGRDVELYPYGLVAQRGLPAIQQGTWILHEGPIGYVGDELREKSYKSLRKSGRVELKANNGWTGITDKYWLTTIIPKQGTDVQYAFNYAGTPPLKGQKDTGIYQADYTGSAVQIPAGQTVSTESHIFVGPKRLLHLEDYAKEFNIPRFDLAVNFGRLWFLSKPFFYALHWLGEATGNFGIAIIIFTIIVRGAVFPLTNTSFKSFAKMKKASPKIAALRQKHGDDKATLQKELMQLYQKEGVNPLAGCIPMVIQIPIFFALYRALFITIEMRHAPFFGWIKDLSAADPTSLFNLFGLIPWDPPAMLMIGVWPCLMLTAMVIQRKLNPPPQDPIQRDMAMYFPFVMAFMMARFASGLVIYWTFSNTFSVLQQMFIMKRMGVPIYLLGESPEEKALNEEVDKGPAVHPLTDMAEDEVEDALFDDHADENGAETSVAKKKTPKKTTKKPVKKATSKSSTKKTSSKAKSSQSKSTAKSKSNPKTKPKK